MAALVGILTGFVAGHMLQYPQRRGIVSCAQAVQGV